MITPAAAAAAAAPAPAPAPQQHVSFPFKKLMETPYIKIIFFGAMSGAITGVTIAYNGPEYYVPAIITTGGLALAFTAQFVKDCCDCVHRTQQAKKAKRQNDLEMGILRTNASHDTSPELPQDAAVSSSQPKADSAPPSVQLNKAEPMRIEKNDKRLSLILPNSSSPTSDVTQISHHLTHMSLQEKRRSRTAPELEQRRFSIVSLGDNTASRVSTSTSTNPSSIIQSKMIVATRKKTYPPRPVSNSLEGIAESIFASLQEGYPECREAQFELRRMDRHLFSGANSLFKISGIAVQASHLTNEALQHLLLLLERNQIQVNHLVLSDISKEIDISFLKKFKHLASITLQNCPLLSEEAVQDCLTRSHSVGYWRFFNCPKIAQPFLQQLGEKRVVSSEGFTNEDEKLEQLFTYLQGFLDREEVKEADILSAHYNHDYSPILRVITCLSLTGVRSAQHLRWVVNLLMFQSPCFSELSIEDSPLTNDDLEVLRDLVNKPVKRISLTRCEHLTAKCFPNLLKHLVELEELVIVDCDRIDEEQVIEKLAKAIKHRKQPLKLTYNGTEYLFDADL
ncbi:MAG: hypothetical protein K0S07_24 [Chlamydiales bacterium]|jgi:hypothetical protein|nr:hypothetical protein [Chlamydiales bacterium]